MEDSLITDFLYSTRLDLPREQLRFPERQNESISWLGLELLRKLNMRVPKFLDDGAPNPPREGAPDLFQLAFKDGMKFKLPSDIANRYRLAYEA